MEQEIDARREAIFCGGLTSGISSLLDNRDEKPYKKYYSVWKNQSFFGRRSDYAIIACTFPMMALGNRCGP